MRDKIPSARSSSKEETCTTDSKEDDHEHVLKNLKHSFKLLHNTQQLHKRSFVQAVSPPKSRKQTVNIFGETKICCGVTSNAFKNELWQTIPVLSMGENLQHQSKEYVLSSCVLVLTIILHGKTLYWPVHTGRFWKIIQNNAVPCHGNCSKCFAYRTTIELLKKWRKSWRIVQQKKIKDNTSRNYRATILNLWWS